MLFRLTGSPGGPWGPVSPLIPSRPGGPRVPMSPFSPVKNNFESATQTTLLVVLITVKSWLAFVALLSSGAKVSCLTFGTRRSRWTHHQRNIFVIAKSSLLKRHLIIFLIFVTFNVFFSLI